MSERPEHELHELLEDFHTAMLATRSGSGMHARPMAVAELGRGGDALFVTAIDSPKVAELETQPEVMLTFQSGSRFAAVYGRVRIERNHERIEQLWKEPWKVWFPRGKDDPALTLLEFSAEHGEYWDNSGPKALRYAYSSAKAYVTGETPEVDEKQHGRVDL